MSDAESLDFGDVESFLGDVTVPTTPTEDVFETPNGQWTFDDPAQFVADAPMPGTEDDSLFGDISQPVGDGTCDVCGAPTFRPPGLTSAGRKKRVPRRCDLHARKPGVQAERPDLSGVESQLRRVQEELADDLKLLGTLAGPLLPVTGYYVFEHADPFTVAILKLAKNNTRVLRILHRAAQ